MLPTIGSASKILSHATPPRGFTPPPIQWEISERLQLASTGGGTTATFSVNIGAADPDRFIVCTACTAGTSPSTCVVNGVTLGSDVSRVTGPSDFYGARIFSGFVTSGSGIVTATVNALTGQNISLTVIRAIGLPNVVTIGRAKAVTSNEGVVGTLATFSVAAGDFVVAAGLSNASGGDSSFTGSTEVASHTMLATATQRHVHADWSPAATTNASWSVLNNIGDNSCFVVASYR